MPYTEKKWLLIYDNVEEIDAVPHCLASNVGHTILTTRYRDMALRCADPKKVIELRFLKDKDAENLFLEMRSKYRQDKIESTNEKHDVGKHGEKKSGKTTSDAGNDDEKAATVELLGELQGLPLGIEQMAAYIEADGITVREFLETYHRMPKTALQRNNIGVPNNHTLNTLWSITFRKVNESNLDAYHLLAMISLTGMDDIPTNIFDNVLLAEEDDILTNYTEFCEDPEL